MRETSWLLLLERKLSQRLFRFPYILERQLAGLDEVRHHRLSAPSKQRQQVIDQPSLRSLAGNRGRKDVEVRDLLHSTDDIFIFQPINGGLDGRIGGPSLEGKGLLNLANRAFSSRPKRLHNPKF